MKTFLRAIIAAVSLLAAAGSCRGQVVVSYNVGAFSKWGGTSYALVSAILSDIGPDFVALQEVDSCTARTSGVNQAERLCRELNGLPCADPQKPWKWAFGASMPYKGGAYGNAVVYRGEAVSTFRIPIPKGTGREPRCCVAVETPEAVFASVHLDYASVQAGLDGAKAVTSRMTKQYRKSSKPVILCGDFNARPDSPVIKYMTKKWILVSKDNQMSFPCRSDKDADRCIDYVWVLKNRASSAPSWSEVVSDIPWRDVRGASDHYPLAASLSAE